MILLKLVMSLTDEEKEYLGLNEPTPTPPLETNILLATGFCKNIAREMGFGELKYEGEGDFCTVYSDTEKTFAFKVRRGKSTANSHISVFESFPWWQYKRGIVLTPHAIIRVAPIEGDPQSVISIFIVSFEFSLRGKEIDQKKLYDLKERLNDFGADADTCDFKPGKEENLGCIEGHYILIDGGAVRLKYDCPPLKGDFDERMRLVSNAQRNALRACS